MLKYARMRANILTPLIELSGMGLFFRDILCKIICKQQSSLTVIKHI